MHPRRWPSYFSSCQYTPLNLPLVMCSSPCDPRPSFSSPPRYLHAKISLFLWLCLDPKFRSKLQSFSITSTCHTHNFSVTSSPISTKIQTLRWTKHSLSLFLGELQCDLNKSFSFQCHLASPPRFAACFAKYKAWSSDPFCFDVQGQNKHTHICLFFRFQVSWLLCFCCLCVGLQPCSNCKCVGISMIGWVLGGSWMWWLLVCGSVCPCLCGWVCTVACCCWVEGLLVAELQSCVYVCVEVQSMLMPHLDN